ncbi:TPA: hypothetical protein ACV44O_004488 [Salmonella enterica]
MLTATSPELKQPQAPVNAITPVNVSPGDIASVVKAWDSRTASLTKAPGFISTTLYQSVLPSHPDTPFVFINQANFHLALQSEQ